MAFHGAMEHPALGQSLDLYMTKTIHRVIVHHTHGLHQGVADDRADEFESAFAEIAAQGLGNRCGRGDVFEGAPFVLAGPPIDKLPQITVEGTAGLLDFAKGSGIGTAA